MIGCLLKSIGQIQFARVSNVCFEIRAFLKYLGAIFLQSLHLPLHPKPLPSPQSKIL